MRTKTGTLMLFAAFLFSLVSCGGGGSSSGGGETPEVPALFSAVPSDALSIAYASSAREVLSSLSDSSSVFYKLRLGDSPAVLSFSYYGELSPMMAVEVGKSSPEDSSSAAFRLLSGAKTAGLQCKYYPPQGEEGKEGFIVLSPSTAHMNVIERHLSEGRSIVDAPDFIQAYSLVAKGDNILIVRGSGVTRTLPESFLKGVFPRRSLKTFVSSLSDWMCFSREEDGALSLFSVQGEDCSYFTNVLSSLPFGESRLGEILSRRPDFALSIPVSLPEYRDKYEEYIDASVKMTQYTRKTASLKASSGISPLEWEKQLEVQEIALIVEGQRRIAALQCGGNPADSEIKENSARGFVQALYGDAFALEDSHCRYSKGWLIVGRADDVEYFSEGIPASREEAPYGTIKNCHIVIYSPLKTLLWDKKGIKIWNSNL